MTRCVNTVYSFIFGSRGRVPHNKTYPHILFILFFWSTIAISDSNNIQYNVAYFEDTKGITSFADVMEKEQQSLFRDPGENGLSFGWVDNPYWFKLSIDQVDTGSELLLEIPWPLLDEIVVYIVDSQKNLIQTHKLGDHTGFSERPIFDSHFVVPIDFRKNQIGEIYFKVNTTSSLQLPLRFWTQKEYFKHRATYYTVQGIFYGLLIVMIFYNLFIYFSTKRVAYLHYVCFVASFGTLQAGLKGAGFQFLWPNVPGLNDYAIALGGSMSLLFLTLFARSFLQLNEAPSLKKINDYMIAVATLFIAASFILDYRTIITPLTLVVLASSLMVIVKAIYRYQQGFHEARYYLVAWVVMVTGCFIYLFKQLGLLPVNFFTENSMQIGSAMEILLLSLALADRLNTLRVGLEDANQKLEMEVSDRTRELVLAMQKLGEANSKLALTSITDGLTGLRNRYHFDIALEKEIDRINRNKTTVSLILLDIDHFKSINDRWGHQIGDKVLQFASHTLDKNCKRKTDIICRYGGEEFAIILPDTNLENASEVARKVCKHIKNTDFIQGDDVIPVTVSVGVATTSSIDSLDTNLLVRAADIALYNAKEDGRNCVHIFTGNLSKSRNNKKETTRRLMLFRRSA